ncbi:MAG: transketolase, partial [Proteobacteria bacterium]|nr:transketolase [Pseudomonadota bacterium]
MDDLHLRCVNIIKGLAMDGVQAANSGHPGMPMGAADMATVLWRHFLKHDPSDPEWPDRDRFILSAGHGAMLIYSLLHLGGYDLSVEDLRQFRQWGSKTPGHPEYGETPGVEMTTGPLGQGFATAVGMAIAERTLRETFGQELVDHYTYAIVGDGDLMEGIAYEAASIAGHLGLGRMIYLYDDNQISIDGHTDITFSEDRCARLEACGWHTQAVDGHDPKAIFAAIEDAKAVTDKPSLIACRTIIGKGCDIEGTSATHGAPLGPDRVADTKRRLGLDPEQSFAVPDEACAAFRQGNGKEEHEAWQARLQEHPRRDEFLAWLKGDTQLLADEVVWPEFEVGASLATRKASFATLKAIVDKAPWVVGGSADLAGSNGTKLGLPVMTTEKLGGAATIHFGVREHSMGAICNGMALHGGF